MKNAETGTKSFRCITFGCRVNQYETQSIREQLLAKGYQEAPEGIPADLVVVNSCTVTEEADSECLKILRRVHREMPGAQIVVTGCLVQRDAQLLTTVPGVRLLAGTGQKHRIAELVEEMDVWTHPEPRVELELEKVYAPLKISSFEGRHKIFLKVQDGCDRVCAFCKIPLVRGRSRSRPLSDLLEEAGRLIDGGYKEITLTGVALGLWGREIDPPLGLGALIEAADQLPGQFRVRLSSLDPRDLDDAFLSALAGSSRVCHHLHLSLQSGSDSVLKRMNREYTTAWYRQRVRQIRRFWPDVGLTTDVITGFPGETEEHFNETLEFCREMEFLKIHIFPYSRRRGTSAWFFKECFSRIEAKKRGRELKVAAAGISEEFRKHFIGTVQEVLVEEGGLSGYTSQFIRVDFDGEPQLPGEVLPVRVTGLRSEGTTGVIDNFNQVLLTN